MECYMRLPLLNCIQSESHGQNANVQNATDFCVEFRLDWLPVNQCKLEYTLLRNEVVHEKYFSAEILAFVIN